MATSSNQPDENMTVGTSKPGHIETAKFYIEGRSLKHRKSQKKSEKEKDTSNTKLKESTSKGGDIYVSEDDVTLPPLRISSTLSVESSQQGNSYREDHESDGPPIQHLFQQPHIFMSPEPRHMRLVNGVHRDVVRLEPSNSKDNYWGYIPLYQAALRGDWARAKRFLDYNGFALNIHINEYSETALIIAAGAGRSSNTIDFVKNLVDMMPEEALELCDNFKCTALHVAAWVGNTEVAKVLLRKRRSLVYIRECNNLTALDMAAKNAKKDTLLHLLEVVKDDPLSKLFPDHVTENNPPSDPVHNDDSAAKFLILVIGSGYYDIALNLVEKYPSLATSKQKNDDCGLKALAKKVSAFKSGSHHKWWQRLIYAQVPLKLDDQTTSHTRGDIENAVGHLQVTRQKCNWARLLVEYLCTSVPCIKSIRDEKEMHDQALKLVKCLCEGVRSLNDSDAYRLRAKDALLKAAKLGIHEVMEEIVESFPNLLWAKDEENLNLFQIAVVERHANVFYLIYQMGDYQQLLVQKRDDKGNNLLHLAGKLAPARNKKNLVIGAAQYMQRELQWFEEVKKFANPKEIDRPNNAHETPTLLFTKEHEKLRAQGEKWMKGTANSCTIPAALIVTVVFAAAISVPGGINATNSIPILYKEVVFNIFAISDAISLFTSITSLLVHLSILTSRFAERDFLFTLPNRLIIGLVTLFLSIIAMLIAFSCALYLLLFGHRNRAWILYPVAALACVPIISFASLQYPLLLDLIKSTYCPGIFGKQSERPFY